MTFIILHWLEAHHKSHSYTEGEGIPQGCEHWEVKMGVGMTTLESSYTGSYIDHLNKVITRMVGVTYLRSHELFAFVDFFK